MYTLKGERGSKNAIFGQILIRFFFKSLTVAQKNLVRRVLIVFWERLENQFGSPNKKVEKILDPPLGTPGPVMADLNQTLIVEQIVNCCKKN